MEPDFGGYATKAGLKCTDGRVIKPEAFQHMDGKKVPLVYMHGHNTPENVLGHAILESRKDGVYSYCFFNASKNAEHVKAAVEHGDLDSLSIYANQLKEMNKVVSHGSIKEVSVVLAGANPGAKIDYVRIAHSEDPDEDTILEDEAIISNMSAIDVSPKKEETAVEHAEGEKPAETEGDDETVEQIYNSMNDKQKTVLHYMVGAAAEEAEGNKGESAPADDKAKTAEHSENTDEDTLVHQEGTTEMGRNVFDQDAKAIVGTETGGQHTISHSDIQGIFADGVKRGSFKEAVHEYVLEHGITNIEVLFPDAKAITNTPEFDKRRTEWVSSVLNETRKTPFAKLKTLVADLTQDEARAKGYIKGNYKSQEWFGVTKRTTGPTTVYKKQHLDRDDILDITDFDVVAWLMAEMRLMLEEEIARAVLIGDGRDEMDVDKIKDPWGAANGDGIRSILNDHEYYVTTLNVNPNEAGADYEVIVDAVMGGMKFYKGTGTPTFYTTVEQLNKFKQARDGMKRRFYKNNAEVAEALGVSRIVTVEPMNDIPGLVGIIVNLADYTLGTNKGGEITSFDDFDIDYNEYKYLLETRLSGALLKIKSALVIRESAPDAELIVPLKPSFNKTTGVITIPTVTGVVYKDEGGATLTAGAQAALAVGETKRIYSFAQTGYYFANTADDSWPFTRPHAA